MRRGNPVYGSVPAGSPFRFRGFGHAGMFSIDWFSVGVAAPGVDRAQIGPLSIDLFRGFPAKAENDAGLALLWLLGQGS